MWAIRSDGVLLVEAAQATDPAPVPLEPEDIVSQLASLTAAREQLDTLAVIAIVPVDGAELMLCELGLAMKLHAAFCVTV